LARTEGKDFVGNYWLKIDSLRIRKDTTDEDQKEGPRIFRNLLPSDEGIAAFSNIE
jgi:hypothetical protein